MSEEVFKSDVLCFTSSSTDVICGQLAAVGVTLYCTPMFDAPVETWTVIVCDPDCQVHGIVVPLRVHVGCSSGTVASLNVSATEVVDVLSQSKTSDTRNENFAFVQLMTLDSVPIGRLDPTPGRHVLDSIDLGATNANTTVSFDSRIGFDFEKSYPVADRTTQLEDVTYDFPLITVVGSIAMHPVALSPKHLLPDSLVCLNSRHQGPPGNGGNGNRC